MASRAQSDIKTAHAPPPAGEADLLARLRAGDAAAYEQLVRSLAPRLLAVARRVTRTEADAEDAVQEAFLSAFKAIGAFDGRSTLSTWLHRIVVNAALMKARRDKARPETSIETLLPQFEGGLHKSRPNRWRDVTPDADASIQRRETLWKALDQLPHDYRTVLILKDMEGMESKAIAASLDISDALVRQRLHRARLALVRLLDPSMAEQRS
jgi:RNA polymerase sigma-70 factor (ECF subfamily)